MVALNPGLEAIAWIVDNIRIDDYAGLRFPHELTSGTKIRYLWKLHF